RGSWSTTASSRTTTTCITSGAIATPASATAIIPGTRPACTSARPGISAPSIPTTRPRSSSPSSRSCGGSSPATRAIRATRRARADMSGPYGHQRYQPLAAYTNGLILLAITVGVVTEALRRLVAPPPVDGGVMLAVAILGGGANLAALLVLSGGSSLNERGARAHVLSDLLGAVAAMLGASVILAFGWLPADPLLSLAVSVLILRAGWQ